MTYSEQRRVDDPERLRDALKRIADNLAPETTTDDIGCYYYGGACVNPDVDCGDCERHLKEESD